MSAKGSGLARVALFQLELPPHDLIGARGGDEVWGVEGGDIVMVRVPRVRRRRW